MAPLPTADSSDRVKLDDLARVVWFAARLDDAADVVQVWTLLRFALTEDDAYDVLNALDKGETWAMWSRDDTGHYDVTFRVITPLDDPADRVYGIEVHTPNDVDLSAEL